MAYYDELARDPESKKEFWAIIDETFVQVEGALTAYPAETREEALAGTLRGDNFKDASISFIRHRGVREDLDSRDYFLELGRRVLPEVALQIKARKLTPKFAKDWGVVMMCHGFISAHILDDSDDLRDVRRGLKTGSIRSKNAQRKWLAHLIIREIDSGKNRTDAEDAVVGKIKAILRSRSYPPGFGEAWFSSMITHGGLASTYDYKHFFVRTMRQLIQVNLDDIPPTNFP
jgi:hypothetical protein